MYIKYTIICHYIMICLTHYIPTSVSIDGVQELQNLWWALTSDGDYVYDNKFYQIYYDEERKELEQVMKNFGSTFENDKDDAIYRMDFENFKKAASKGYIHRWSKQTMRNAFNEMIPCGKNREYITRVDMISHYGHRAASQIDSVMSEYGQVEEGQCRLYFYNFRIAMNIHRLPAPVCENTSLVAIYNEFNKMLDEPGRSYVTKKHIINYYEPQIKKIVEDYGIFYNENYELNFYNFLSAISSGHLRIPLYGERITSPMELRAIFDRMTNGGNEVNITYEHLIELYEPQIDNIIIPYGEFYNDEYVLFFHQFREVIVGNHLPLKL